MSVQYRFQTCVEAHKDTRDVQVAFLQQLSRKMTQLSGLPLSGLLLGFATPDKTVMVGCDLQFDDDLGIEATPWLSDTIKGLTSQPITGFVVGFTPLPHVALTYGVTAAGRCEEAATFRGISLRQDLMNDVLLTYFAEQARVLWGPAWSPLP